MMKALRLRAAEVGVATIAVALMVLAGTTTASGSSPLAGTPAAAAAQLSEDRARAEVLFTQNLHHLATAVKAQEEAAVAAERKAAATERQAAASRETTVRSQAVSDPRAYAAHAASQNHGWGADQMVCLESLWTKESNWDYQAQNPSSGAYGIPQSLPGSKMASAGADWASNPATQIDWGLGYIADVYGSPCGAWSHSQSVGWY